MELSFDVFSLLCFPLFDLLIFSLNVITSYGTSLPVASCGALFTSCFYVPNILHVSHLTTIFSAAPHTDSGCRVILDIDSCSIQDRRMKAMARACPRRHDSQGIWELYWLNYPSVAITPTSSCALATSTFASF
jgi:hypothetical protein